MSQNPISLSKLKHCLWKKNRLQRRYAKKPITYDEAYKRIRNKVTQTIRIAKGNYYKRQLERHVGNCRNTWRVVNSILNRNLKDKITNPLTIAQHFNEYFVNVGKDLADWIPDQGKHFKKYMQNRQENEFKFPLVTEKQLLAVIRKFKDSAAGADDVPMTNIKEVALELSSVLVYLVRLSFATEIFPDTLKIAKV